MRLAVLSDIHGNRVALDACLDDLAAEGGADAVVVAGDLCMDGPRPREVLERLGAMNARCVRGNTDRAIAENDDPTEAADVAWQREQIGPDWTAYLRDLPFSLRFGDAGNALFVSHANPKSDDDHVWPDAGDDALSGWFGDVDATAFAFGHLHLPYTRLWRGKVLACVASAGLPKDGDARAHYAILTARDGGWQIRSRRVPFDVDRVVKQLVKSDMPHTARRLSVLRRHRYKALEGFVP